MRAYISLLKNNRCFTVSTNKRDVAHPMPEILKDLMSDLILYLFITIVESDRDG